MRLPDLSFRTVIHYNTHTSSSVRKRLPSVWFNWICQRNSIRNRTYLSRNPIPKTIQSTSRKRKGVNGCSSLFLDKILYLHKYRCEDIDTDCLSIPYHIPYKSTNKETTFLFPLPMRGVFADDIGIHNWFKNDLKPKNQYPLPSFSKTMLWRK